jgi:hypothetical protein
LNNENILRRDPARTWGGPAVVMPCTIGAVRITANDTEYELQFKRNGKAPALDRFHGHLRCFAVRELERTEDRR